MTIMEVEERTGMTRANVRFYENEGLLSPQRTKNGYRDYSEADVETLQKIRLLRAMHIPLDEIRRIQSGEDSLSHALWQVMKDFEQNQKKLEKEKQLCQLMRDDEVSYDSLNAEHYLERMKHDIPLQAVTTDIVTPPPYIPWRRYCARYLDMTLYGTLFESLILITLRLNPTKPAVLVFLSLANLILPPALMLLFEPVFLSRFGTTPGKWILGIRVLDADGKKLSYETAMRRCRKIFRYLFILYIPVYRWFRISTDVQDYRRTRELDWDYECDTAIFVKDIGVQAAAYIAAFAALIGLTAFFLPLCARPVHRGNLTIAEFCQNYNHYVRYYNVNSSFRLTENGKWDKDNQYHAVYRGPFSQPPTFEFTEQDGVMTGFEYTQTYRNSRNWIPVESAVRDYAIFSFVKAQDGCHFYSGGLPPEITQNGNTLGYSAELYGVSLELEITFSNYLLQKMRSTNASYLIPEPDKETECRVHFSMTKTR